MSTSVSQAIVLSLSCTTPSPSALRIDKFLRPYMNNLRGLKPGDIPTLTEYFFTVREMENGWFVLPIRTDVGVEHAYPPIAGPFSKRRTALRTMELVLMETERVFRRPDRDVCRHCRRVFWVPKRLQEHVDKNAPCRMLEVHAQ